MRYLLYKTRHSNYTVFQEHDAKHVGFVQIRQLFKQIHYILHKILQIELLLLHSWELYITASGVGTQYRLAETLITNSLLHCAHC